MLGAWTFVGVLHQQGIVFNKFNVISVGIITNRAAIGSQV